MNTKSENKQYSIISKNIPCEELWKYLTGNTIEVPTLTNNSREGIGLFPEYRIPIGSLINDFIEHKSKPWWKRKWYHNRLTEIYV